MLILSASSPSEYLPSNASSPAPAGDCSLPFLLIQHWKKQPPLTLGDTSTGRWCTPPKCGGVAPSQPQGSVLQSSLLDHATLIPWFRQWLVTAFSVATFVISFNCFSAGEETTLEHKFSLKYLGWFFSPSWAVNNVLCIRSSSWSNTCNKPCYPFVPPSLPFLYI